MNKIRTYSGDIAHLTEDDEKTLCGRTIYPSWTDEVEGLEICDKCEKEIEIDGKESTVGVEPSGASKPKKWRMATWEN